jgi:hypothetical protein
MRGSQVLVLLRSLKTWIPCECASDDQGHIPRWTAPEILNNQGTYSKEADVFSFAMVMIEVR